MPWSGSAGNKTPVAAGKEAWMYANVIFLTIMAKEDNAIYAAIAMALHDFRGNNVHDREPGIITIKQRATMWNAKAFQMTAKPSRH